MNNLPFGWVETTLGEIGEVRSGVGFPIDEQGSADGKYPVYKVSDVSRGVLLHRGELVGAANYVSESVAASLGGHIFPVGSTLFAKIGEALRLNRRAIVRRAGLADNNVMGFKSHAGINDELIYYFLRTQNLASLSRSTTIPSIRKGDIEAVKILLPPAAEQKRIAQKLDALLAQVDTLKARIDAIPALITHFRQIVTSTAVSGNLTKSFSEKTCSSDDLLRGLMGDHARAGGHSRGNASMPVEEAHDLTQDKIPTTWRVAELRDVCEPGRPITYGILKPGPELENGIPYIRVADFPGNKLNPSTVKNTSEEIDFAYRRARLKVNDLLLSIRGSVGRIIKIPPAFDGANITQDTARLSISGRVSVDYVLLAMRAEDTQRRMRAATKGVAVRGINIGDVRALQIPLPGIDEQREIVRRAEQLFKIADQLQEKITTAKQRIDALTQSLLAKAFRGELVPQDPNDEPVSELLARIRAQRADAPKPKRGRKANTLAKDTNA